MLFFMMLCLLVRGSALIYLLVNVYTVLPNGVLGCTALICAVFAALIFHYFAHGIKRRHMEFAFLLNSIIVLFDMFWLRFGVPSSLGLFEYVAAGTLFEVVVGMVLVVLSRQRTAMLMAKNGI